MSNLPTGLRAVIFDMDGVLIDAKDWHKDALNLALKIFGEKIGEEEHAKNFDGLPTKVKLAKLSEEGRLPTSVHSTIEQIKQDCTIRLAAERLRPNAEHHALLSFLKSRGVRTALATNSIRKTTNFMIALAGLDGFFDIVLTNEDVEKPKPNPEIYRKSINLLRVVPDQVLVFEDSHFGIQAASAANCRVVKVDSPLQVSLNFFLDKMKEFDWTDKSRI